MQYYILTVSPSTMNFGLIYKLIILQSDGEAHTAMNRLSVCFASFFWRARCIATALPIRTSVCLCICLCVEIVIDLRLVKPGSAGLSLDEPA